MTQPKIPASETARLLRRTLSSLREAVLVVGREGELRVIQEANDAAERIFGYAREELIGVTTEMLHVDQGAFERFATEGDPHLEARGVYQGRFDMRRKDGTVFKAEQTVTLLDPDVGIEGGAVSVIRDISKRAEAEARLRESERRFRQFAEHIDDIFWMRSPDGEQLLYVSPAFEDVVGRARDELYDDPLAWLDAVHPEDRERIERAVIENRDGGFEQEYRIVRPDGEIRWIWDRGFPVVDERGTVYRMVGVAEDVTARRQLEEQLQHSQKMEAVGRLAGGIAHDFNNLLSVIRSQADLLEEDWDESPDPEDLAVIRDAADRAADLTGQLLAFSREQVLRPRVVDLNRVVEGMEQLFRRVLGEDIRIEKHLAADLPPVRVDPRQVEQVLMNLAVNARDAMPEGGALRISTTTEELEAREAASVAAREAAGPLVRLDVTDTGVGMSEEVRRQVFEPFFTTKESSGGTGLGLATAYGIVQQSGGSIHVASRPGAGTTFTIRFPSVEGEVEVSEPEPRPEPEGRVGALSGRVLVVEDDAGVRAVARKVLVRHGLEVRTAGSAEAALELLEDGGAGVDLVLTDMVLPEMGGRELMEALRERAPGLPVVVMSGYSEGSPGTPVDLSPDVPFLQKPFSPASLVSVVRAHLPEG